jgi:signal transduction histidine kinase
VLESEKGKLAAIIYSLIDGVIMVDTHNQLLVYNPTIRKIFNLSEDKSVTIFDIVDGLAGKLDLRTKIEQAIKQDKPVISPEVFIKDKALEITVSPVKDNSGLVFGASVLFHDITTEKSLEKLRQEFTAMMVHELRAPLTAVRWSSESMVKNLATAQGIDPQKIKDTAVTIETASNNMLELVNDLLDVAKIEAGKFELNLQENDLVEILMSQVRAFTPQVEMKHLTISLTNPPKCMVKLDKVRISQVLGNLLSNAIKYTDSGEIHVDLQVKETDNQVVVAVKDSGIGIPQEDLNMLFSKFKQLKSGDRSRKGTGLGLVVSKGIVESHNGKIWAESAGENLGSIFYFSLPIK